MAGALFKMDLNRLQQAVSRAANQAGNLSGLSEALGEMLVSSTVQRFEDEEGPDGKKWEKSARAEDEGGQTLTDTGSLKGSISYEAGSNAVTVGTNKIYAGPHQFGGTIKPKKAGALVFDIGGKTIRVKKVDMPERPFLGINEEDEAEARDIIRNFYKELFR